MWRLVNGAVRHLHWWWRGDRVRASPREGRLLRLRPPCYLRVEGEAVEVLARHAEGACVRYRCAGARGDCDVTVRFADALVTVRGRDGERAVEGDDIEVIPAGPGVACSRRSNC